MKTKFTKGKWRYSKEHNCITTSKIGIVEGSKIICDIKEFPTFDYSGEEAKANALLISKAPEMFEMLQLIVDAQFNPEKSLANLNSEILKAKQLLKEATEL